LIIRRNKLYTDFEYHDSVYHGHVCSQFSTSVQVLLVEFLVGKVTSGTGTEYCKCDCLYRYRGFMKYLNVAQDEVFRKSIPTEKGESDKRLEKVE